MFLDELSNLAQYNGTLFDLCCIKYGVIYDTFDPSERLVEYAWFVE